MFTLEIIARCSFFMQSDIKVSSSSIAITETLTFSTLIESSS